MESEPKQFWLPVEVSAAIDELAGQYGGKGQLRVIGTAALLLFLQADEETRRAYCAWAEGVARGAYSPQDGPPVQGGDLAARVRNLEEALTSVARAEVEHLEKARSGRARGKPTGYETALLKVLRGFLEALDTIQPERRRASGR